MEKMDWITSITNANSKPDNLEGCMNKNGTVTLIMKFIINHFSLDTDWILIFTMYIAYKVFCKMILNSKYTASDFGENQELNCNSVKLKNPIQSCHRSIP